MQLNYSFPSIFFVCVIVFSMQSCFFSSSRHMNMFNLVCCIIWLYRSDNYMNKMFSYINNNENWVLIKKKKIISQWREQESWRSGVEAVFHFQEIRATVNALGNQLLVVIIRLQEYFTNETHGDTWLLG